MIIIYDVIQLRFRDTFFPPFVATGIVFHPDQWSNRQNYHSSSSCLYS